MNPKKKLEGNFEICTDISVEWMNEWMDERMKCRLWHSARTWYDLGMRRKCWEMCFVISKCLNFPSVWYQHSNDLGEICIPKPISRNVMCGTSVSPARLYWEAYSLHACFARDWMKYSSNQFPFLINVQSRHRVFSTGYCLCFLSLSWSLRLVHTEAFFLLEPVAAAFQLFYRQFCE